MRKTIILLVLVSILSIGYANALTYISRDSCMSIASTYCYATWTAKAGNCYPGYNLYTVGRITQGIDYNWGGYDTLAGALTKLYAGATAGDGYPNIYSDWAGNDCSGYVSRCWISGHQTTSSFTTASYTTTLNYTDLYKGDLTDYAGSHCRLFDYFSSGTNYLMSYECTAGVSPSRVTHRILARDNNYAPLRYKYITPFTPTVPVELSSFTSE